MTRPSATEEFRAARDLLLLHRDGPGEGAAEFRWPRPTRFNWALDWFDAVAAERGDGRAADRGRRRLPDTDRELTFRDLSRRSAQVAAWLRSLGVRRGDPVLLMLGNRAEVWETMLAAIKLGAIVIPTYTAATPAELADRLDRGDVRYVVAEAGLAGRFDEAGDPGRAGGRASAWAVRPRAGCRASCRGRGGRLHPLRHAADDPLFRYFTSGTTSKPKMVEHTHVSYPVGHLSGMYWNGVEAGRRCT